MTEPVDTETIPVSGGIPKGDILLEIFERVGFLSDELNDPHGVLSVSLDAIRSEANDRHNEIRSLMIRVLDEVLEVRSRVEFLEEQLGERAATVN